MSTYRIQFSSGFTFEDAEHIIPYLSDLGISHIYASPIFKAVKGSTHGYDVVSPEVINPELGGEEKFRHLRSMLSDNGIGWVQDFVPNHMAFSTENVYLNDIFQSGKSSPYSGIFDIDWENPFFKDRIVAPILGKSYEEEIENIRFERTDGGYQIRYYDHILPVETGSASVIESLNGIDHPEDASSLTLTKGMKESILQRQHYVLRNWKSTNHEINYRRFFNVNGLIAINSVDTGNIHFISKKLYQLIEEGLIDGIRLDHIDGLYDPYDYLKDLRKMFPELIILVEKILSYREELNPKWPVEGTTGYDFLFLCNALQSDGNGSAAINSIYRSTVSSAKSSDDIVRESKEGILDRELYGDLINITYAFYREIQQRDYGHDVTFKSLFISLREFIICLPVYRTYIRKGRVWDRDVDVIRSAIHQASRSCRSRETCFDVLERYFLEFETLHDGDPRIRIQQYEPAFYAKSIEDRLFYLHNPLVSRNEVGNDPYIDYMTPAEFHEIIQIRMSSLPETMNLTSTHDTKFGEDLRARINAIQDNPELWNISVRKWASVNSRFLRVYQGVRCPNENQEYLIYQVLGGSEPHSAEDREYRDRFSDYLIKIIREGGRTTEWYEPDLKYERSFRAFLDDILDASKNQEFLKDLLAFQERLSYPGYINSLVQTILKLTVPGFPDIYSGSEGFNFSFVDPDNRRPVDYHYLGKVMENLPDSYSRDDFMESFMDSGKPHIKMFLIRKLLDLRRRMKHLFDEGSYVPVYPSGARSDDSLIYARRSGRDCLMVILPLHTGSILGTEAEFQDLWNDTRVDFDGMSGIYESLISARKVSIASREMDLRDLMAGFPFEILVCTSLRGEGPET